MCGIVGLFSKSEAVEERLGEHLGRMLAQMGDRGPDSAGVALYRNPAPSGASKVSLFSADPREDWGALRTALDEAFGGQGGEPEVRASHAVFVVDTDAESAEEWLREHRPDLRIMSAGERIEIFKEMGLPRDFVQRFALGDMAATHGLGHTRMATESRVTTEHSHPFSTGLDLCLVHNGSLSNHNRLRQELRREGITFTTDNDTEVAAGYLTWRLREGASLERRSRAASRTSTGSTPSPSAPPTASRCCATRSRASPP
jgi:glutamate synthase domain-containing protein 1